jgi:hypothetical protein
MELINDSNNSKSNGSFVIAIKSTNNFIKEKSKVDFDSPNEFSSGNSIRLTELIVIIFIIFIWILSLRKLVKNFEKLRTTRYREIPYKYQSNQINSKSRHYDFQNESVSKSTFRQLNHNETNKKVNFNLNDKKNELKSSSSLDLNNFEAYQLKDIEFIDTKIVLNTEVENETVSLKNTLNLTSESELINPSLLSPIIRTSLIDLHRKSMENLWNINESCSVSTFSIESKKTQKKIEKKKNFFSFFKKKSKTNESINYDETKL